MPDCGPDCHRTCMRIKYVWRSRIAWALAGLAAVLTGHFIAKSMDSATPVNATTFGAAVAFAVTWAVRMLFGLYEQHRMNGKIVFEFRTPDLLIIGKRIVIAVAVVYLGLAGFHFLTTGDPGAGFRMATTDVKVAARCPHKPATVAGFIARSDFESFTAAFASFWGENVPKYVCENGWPPPL